MAKIVTLKSSNDEDIYPVTDASGIRVTGNITLQQALDGFVYADDPTSSANPDGWITNSDLNYGTLVKSGIWTTTTTLSGTGSSTTTNISVEEFDFASGNDYAVEAMVVASSSNYWATKICIENKTATSFTLRVFNDHWAGGAIGSGTKIQWTVFRLN